MKPSYVLGEVSDSQLFDQFENILDRPEVVSASLLPNSAIKQQSPEGCTIITKGGIHPKWIGHSPCLGTTVARLNITFDAMVGKLDDIHAEIIKTVPMGNFINKKPEPTLFLDRKVLSASKVCQDMFNDKAKCSIGSLGGTSGAIIIGRCSKGMVHVTIQTGSRGFGRDLADHYIGLAKDELVTDQTIIDDYIRDMAFVEWYGQTNRYRIMTKVCDALTKIVGAHSRDIICNTKSNQILGALNKTYIHLCGTSFVPVRNMFSLNTGPVGGVYLLLSEGLAESNHTFPYGVGREMGRMEAKQAISQEQADKEVEGIVCDLTGKCDDAPSAYKDADSIIGALEPHTTQEKFIRTYLYIRG